MAGYPGYGGPPQGPGGYGAPGGYGQQQPAGFGQQPPAPGGFGAPQPAAGYGPPQGMPGMDPQVTQWFQTVDRDRSGRITVTELQQALTNANWSHFNIETCRLMIRMYDFDGSGSIELAEFQQLWSCITQWKGVFDQFDRDRSGSIDANELCNAFNQMGYRLSGNFANLVVRSYDSVQGGQRLSLDNFIQASVRLKSFTDRFQRKDTQRAGMITLGYEEFLAMAMQ